MPRNLRIFLIAIAVPLVLALTAVAAFAFDRFAHRDEVLRNISIADRDLSGLNAAAVENVVLSIEDELSAVPAVFVISGTEFVMDPAAVGLDIDEQAVVAAAFAEGRSGNWWKQFDWWTDQLSGQIVLDIPITVNEAAVIEILAEWERTAIDRPPYNGAIVIEDGRPKPLYPQPGVALDLAVAQPLVLDALKQRDRRPVELPTRLVDPQLSVADLDAAVTEAEFLVSEPITLVAEGGDAEVTFSPIQLLGALKTEVIVNSPATIELEFDVAAVEALLAPLREQLESPPVDARFELDEEAGTVELIPGSTGTLVDPELVAEALLEAAFDPARVGELPLVKGAQPEFTTAEAEAMMPITLVSEFTTRHSCCQTRVNNIHLFADAVDGTIVWPGEVLSLNDLVGERTLEKGYRPAGTIIAGKLEDTVGGGVSQFATTFYNAVFFGGYEDIEHSPHSLYFSRYPEGREATISWPQPDLKFRNNSDAIIIIDTSYTDRSITVKFYGNNGGRVIEPGLSSRYNYTNPPKEFIPDPEVAPGEEVLEEEGRRGWSVTVYRTITYPDGNVVEEEWRHRYRPEPDIFRVHPCELPENHESYTGEECPLPIPEVVGQAEADAKAALTGAGFTVTVTTQDVTIESGQDGLVVAQDPTGFAAEGAAVTITVGKAPPPPSTTTTTTSTTTTTTTAP